MTVSVSPKDMMFFRMAAIGGMTEVEAGKLAAFQGSSQDVKNFGQRMVDDHTKADDQLKMLAVKKNVTLPTTPDAKHRAMLDQLKDKQGIAFDTTFIADMKIGHTNAISLFTEGSKSKDPDVAQFASGTLPTLKDHQAHIPTLGIASEETKTRSSSPTL
jgi:putative membrane protein